MAQIIKANGETLEVEPLNGKDFKLEEIQKIIGGYMECIYLSRKMLMIVDEEGKIKNKPFNIKATRIPKISIHGDYIAGDVLLCKQSEVK